MGKFTSSCGNSIYTASQFPNRLRGAYFVCDPLHNLVHCDLLSPDGATFSASRAFEQKEFLASTDAWFKPVFTTVGPDGALYVVDYYRKYIEHPDYVPEGLEGQFDLRAGAGKGRIYRVSYQGRPLETTKPELQGAESRQLVQTLAHPNMWWRITAQRLLVERQDESALPSLRKLLLSAESPESRIHGLWSLEGLGGLEPDLLLEALVDEDPGVREHAVRLSEQVESASVRAKLLDLLEDPDDRVQFQLACTLGLLPEADSFPALTQILNRHQENRWFQIAVLASAAENAGRWFQTIIRDRAYLSSDSEGKRELLSRITTILGARHLESEIATVLDFVTDPTDVPSDWWRSASLAGLGLGLGQAGASKLSLAPRTERSLFQLIGSPSPKVAEAALDLADLVRLANSRGLRRLIRDAVTTSESAAKGISRVNAVRIMALDPTESTIPVLDQLLGPQEPSEIQTAAAKSLLQQGHPQSVPLLLGKWKSYTEPVRKVVWEGFLARRRRTSIRFPGKRFVYLVLGSIRPLRHPRSVVRRLCLAHPG